MGFKTIDRQRGARLRQAMAARGDLKMMAMAAEMGVSQAVVAGVGETVKEGAPVVTIMPTGESRSMR